MAGTLCLWGHMFEDGKGMKLEDGTPFELSALLCVGHALHAIRRIREASLGSRANTVLCR